MGIKIDSFTYFTKFVFKDKKRKWVIPEETRTEIIRPGEVVIFTNQENIPYGVRRFLQDDMKVQLREIRREEILMIGMTDRDTGNFIMTDDTAAGTAGVDFRRINEDSRVISIQKGYNVYTAICGRTKEAADIKLKELQKNRLRRN